MKFPLTKKPVAENITMYQNVPEDRWKVEGGGFTLIFDLLLKYENN